MQHTLSAALQQLAALRDELAAAQQQGREQQQLAAAEAAAAQQQQDGASGEEVEQLVEERDAAIRLAEGLHQEVRQRGKRWGWGEAVWLFMRAVAVCSSLRVGALILMVPST